MSISQKSEKSYKNQIENIKNENGSIKASVKQKSTKPLIT